MVYSSKVDYNKSNSPHTAKCSAVCNTYRNFGHNGPSLRGNTTRWLTRIVVTMRICLPCIALSFLAILSHSFKLPRCISARRRKLCYPGSNLVLDMAQTEGIRGAPIVLARSYNVALGVLAASALSVTLVHNLFIAGALGLFGLFLFVQTGKIRFVFDDEALEVLVAKPASKGDGELEIAGEKLERSRDNFAVGGRNRWNYTAVTDWFFIPSRNFPVLMYFKEVQTPGSTDNGRNGQIHFFPVVMDSQQLEEQMVTRVGRTR